MSLVLLGLWLSIALAAFVCWRAVRPLSFTDAIRHALICVAHSDDCAIIGAEYAAHARRAGKSVRIVYLTCSASAPDSEMAKRRRQEAIAAWAQLDVPADQLTFIDLTESPIDGPVTYDAAQLARATASLTTLVQGLAPDAAVIVPARGESHIDHRTVRRLALQAVAEASRSDLVVYDSPEYNAHLSLRRSPERTVRTVLRCIPGFTRLVRAYAGAPGYVDGNVHYVTFQDGAGLRTKREMLRTFASQDGELLIRFFGFTTPYRAVHLHEASKETEQPPTLRAFDGDCDASAWLWAGSIWLCTVLSADAIGRALLRVSIFSNVPHLVLTLATGLVALLYVVRWRRGRNRVETALIACAPALGLTASWLG